jgi:hypothetical protein
MRELNEMELDAVGGGRNSVRISHVSQKNSAVVVKSALIDVDQTNDIHIDINQGSSPQRYPAPAPA